MALWGSGRAKISKRLFDPLTMTVSSVLRALPLDGQKKKWKAVIVSNNNNRKSSQVATADDSQTERQTDRQAGRAGIQYSPLGRIRSKGR